MSLILTTSIALRALALWFSLQLAWRIRDARVLLLSAMLALMAVRQVLTLFSRGSAAPPATELPGLVVSLLGLAAVYVLGRLMREMADKEQALASNEAHFRHLIESSVDGIVLLDQSGRIRYANPSMGRVLGYAPAELEGRISLELVAAEDQELIRREFALGIASPGTLRTVNCTMVHSDGSPREIEARGARVETPGGESSVLLTIRDVSDMHEAQRARELLQAQLYQAQKMETLGTLAGGIAHDFNNALMPIVGSAQLARQRLPRDSDARKHIERILEGAGRARELVQRMLLIGRKARLTREPVELAEVVREALGLLRVSLPSSIEIQSDLGDAPCVVSADSLQLHQVLMNLCTNAAHAMPDGGVLRVELRVDEPDAVAGEHPPAVAGEHPPAAGGEDPRAGLDGVRWARLSVSDTGVGMDPEVATRVFEPFFSTRGAGEGSGLGLSVVHGIVEGHGGVIDLESAPGHGACFTVRLPTTDEHPKPRISVHSLPPLAGAGRVLLVDDDLSVVTVSSMLLQDAGYKVDAFTDPKEALSRFAADASRYAAVVTDHTMPGMTGAQLAVRIERLRPGMPVILTTGFAESDVAGASGSAISEVLQKPYETSELVAAIQRATAEPSDVISAES